MFCYNVNMFKKEIDKMVYAGLDVGSTTIKLVILNENKEVVYKRYERHLSNIKKTIHMFLSDVVKEYNDVPIKLTVTGSGGLSSSKWLEVPFIQEVIACVKAVEETIEGTDVVIELGGEDAKITFFTNGIEQRMNGTCAGGTGAFIDQMAALMNTDAAGLNDLAKNAKEIYPIAARCGVFAKSDIQPLLNEGARKEDIAISVFQSVVNQTISGLACGRPIRGKVVFLGGPLFFLTELKQRFKETLNLAEADAVSPEDGQYYVAIGAARSTKDNVPTTFNQLLTNLTNHSLDATDDVTRMEALFENETDYLSFKERHAKSSVPIKDMATYHGNAYLGIDAGSTTTKMVLIDDNGDILYQFYANNEGSPLRVLKGALLELYDRMHEGIKIKKSAVTGYGEALIKAALFVDIGEIETVAHYTAAEHFVPNVDFILDIGGQDMKCMTTKDGIIQTVVLNEACSAGCGSFIENFAQSLDVSIPEFVDVAIKSKNPVDLGSRCTVFMNSKVKQAQKEGATVGDISAGLAYSVIKNALYKVIRLKSKDDLGDHVICQGGTFLNDAVLRAFELQTGKEVIRPNIAGIMGAYGCALIAKEDDNPYSSLISQEDLINLDINSTMRRCGLCQNNCILTVYDFLGIQYISGNRCERGLGLPLQKSELPNLFEYKNKRLFTYKPVKKENAKLTVGIPRVLNMYENYPFWVTFFNHLNFRMVLSPPSNNKIYQKGIETIPSESVCYPAKLVHGHISWLLEQNLDFIFYPSVMYEHKEDLTADNQFNCPIVISYPEVIKNNVDDLKDKNIPLVHPFISFHDFKLLPDKLYEVFKHTGVSKKEVTEAVKLAVNEMEQVKIDTQKEGERALKYMNDNNLFGIVLAGRPYHIDPEVHHGLDKLISGYGFVVFSEDSLAHLGSLERPIRVVDQWVYHNRLYRTANFVTEQPRLELVQLTSFGCGLDAVTADQVKEILERHNKIYTLIKIDEVNNLGAARIRIRSLKAAIEKRHQRSIMPIESTTALERVIFTKEMKKTHTILAPQMSPIHFELLEPVFKKAGYKVEILHYTTLADENTGLKYVHNDACYPSILVVGQLMEALKSGKYDLDKVALLITQTGGGCRATNYIAFIRKALKDMHLEHIPVISLNSLGKELNPGFKLSYKLIKEGLQALVYGDLLMKVLYRVRPYEITKGSANELYNKYNELGKTFFTGKLNTSFDVLCYETIQAFDRFPMTDEVKPKVGLVGEILVKFHPYANNDAVRIVEEEGGEAVMPALYDFFLYTLKNSMVKADLIGYHKKMKPISNLIIKYMERVRKNINKYLSISEHFTAYHNIHQIADGAKDILSLGNQTGEGWFLTGEMVSLIKDEVPNIICMQPFACLPNHVVGKGMIKALRNEYHEANIVAIDYDPGASSVNQLNRIKLMMAVAHKNLDSN